MAEVKDKIITTGSLKALHDYNGNTYLKTDGALTTLGVTATVDELNILDGATASTDELNILDGLTATTNELNYVSGVTSNIQTQLNEKALSGHSHSEYFSSDGGTISGEVNIGYDGAIVRLNDVQTLYNSGTYIVLASNDLNTRICGSAITATQTIQVDSDERLKENIIDVNKEDCVDFINNVDVKTFNYIGNDKECMGVIAQGIENSSLAKFFVAEGENGYLSVKVADFVFPLIATVQELTKEVEELKTKLANV